MYFAIYMLPVIIAPALIWLFWRKNYDLMGYVIQALVGLVTATIFAMFSLGFPSYSMEILNTEIVSKTREKVSCSHSYDCEPYQYCETRDKKQVCETRYKTCYEHSYDVSWRVQTGLEEFTISRVNRRGDQEPSRWSQVKIGEPAAHTHSYRDYIKTNPDSIFNLSNAELMKTTYAPYLPNYPDKIYDYHRIDRVLIAGKVPVPDLPVWNESVSVLLKKLGPQTQTNLVIVFTDQDSMFAEALKTHWLLARKNDVVVVAGVTAWPKLEWVKVFSWSSNDMLNIGIREDLMHMETVDRAKFLEIVRVNTLRHFVRKPMADYSYIKPPPPSMWTVIILFILSIVVTITTNILIRKYNREFY